MIYILHGEDISGSYNRLSQILTDFPNHQKCRLTDKATLEDLYLAIFTQDLLDSPKIIICENFFQSKKIEIDFLKKIPKDLTVVFWEQKELPKTETIKIGKLAIIENFKPQPKTFLFLDSLSPQAQKSLAGLAKFTNSDDSTLLWHLTNRFLLLILAKLGSSLPQAQTISGRNLLDWQWAKIKNQAKLFQLQSLCSLYTGALKIDTMIKTGASNLKSNSLISVLFLKYLTH